MSKVDAIVSFNGKVYFFEGSQYTKYDQASFQQELGYPLPIAGNWPNLFESDIDAATNWGTSGKAFFFKGSECIGYELQSDKADEAKPIEDNWPGVFESDIDAAVDWGNGKLYFFKGSEYTRYDIANDKADDGYPMAIAGHWDRLWSEGIDAAVNWGNGKVYFFSGDEYVSYDKADDKVDSGYPKKIDDDWPPSTATATATATAGQLSAGRQNMLDLIDKWMPTSLLQPRIPAGEKRDLLAEAGWTKATGVKYKAEKDAGLGTTTSCGDVLSAMLRLWKSNFVGAFAMRDVVYVMENGKKVKKPGAKELGYYVEADKVDVRGDQGPKPGDILVFRNGVGSGTAGTLGHTGILYKITPDVWYTADGGGGLLPDQTVALTPRTVEWINDIPILKSPTDIRKKQLDGWVDLDRLEQTGG